MADVQIEDGFTRVANELLEALFRTPLPGRYFRVMIYIIRNTYGRIDALRRHKKRAPIGSTEISHATGIDAADVRRTLRDLAAWNLITRSGGGTGRGDRPMVGVQKDWEKWTVERPEESSRKKTKEGLGHPSLQESGVKKRGDVTPLKKAGCKSGVVEKRGEGSPRERGEGSPHSKENKENTPLSPADAGEEGGSDGSTCGEDYPLEHAHPLANVLGQLPGDRAEKLAWLDSGIGLEILYAADTEFAEKGGELNAIRKRIAIARYRTYLKGDRIHRDAAVFAAHRAKRAAQASRSPPEPAMAANDCTAYETSTVIQGMFDD